MTTMAIKVLIKTGLVPRCSSLQEKEKQNASRRGGEERRKKKEDAEVGSSSTRMDRVIQRGFFFTKLGFSRFPAFPLFFSLTSAT